MGAPGSGARPARPRHRRSRVPEGWRQRRQGQGGARTTDGSLWDHPVEYPRVVPESRFHPGGEVQVTSENLDHELERKARHGSQEVINKTRLKKKALDIRSRTRNETNRKKDVRFISIPNSKVAENITKKLETTSFRVALTSGKKIGELTKKRVKGNRELSVVYQVPCGNCDKSYIGETGRGIQTRIKEHKRDLRNDADHSAFVIHAHSTAHLPNWDGAKVIARCGSKGCRKATEAAFITTNETIKTRVVFINWAKSAAAFSRASANMLTGGPNGPPVTRNGPPASKIWPTSNFPKNINIHIFHISN